MHKEKDAAYWFEKWACANMTTESSHALVQPMWAQCRLCFFVYFVKAVCHINIWCVIIVNKIFTGIIVTFFSKSWEAEHQHLKNNHK